MLKSQKIFNTKIAGVGAEKEGKTMDGYRAKSAEYPGHSAKKNWPHWENDLSIITKWERKVTPMGKL